MNKRLNSVTKLLISVSLIALTIPVQLINAATLTGGSVTISDSRPSEASVTYTINFDNITLSAIKCIKVGFSSSISAQTKPTGMTITGATYVAASSDYVPDVQTWSISNNNTDGVSSITQATGETPASASDGTVVISGITNGSVVETSYFVLFNTYTDVGCSSGLVDSGVVAFIYANGQLVTATVDPTLTFTVTAVAASQTVNGSTTTVLTTDGTVPLGTLSTGANSIAAHTLAVGTNAAGGYTVTAHYTDQLSNGSHDLTDWTGTNGTPTTFSAAGSEYFGYTTEDFTLSGSANRFQTNKWAAFTTTAAEIMYGATAGSESIKFGYQAGIASTTPAGVYQTTVIFIATPTY